MSERTFAWSEGTLWLWTGTASASAVAYAENSNVTCVIGYENIKTLSGYRNHETGRRADVQIGAILTYDQTIAKMFNSATAVHLKLDHSGVMGSAGMVLWSGRIAQMNYQGNDSEPYKWQMSYYANIWSAYGG